MRRSAGIYILLLVILTGLYYYLNNRPQEIDDETPVPTSAPTEYLFSLDDGLPTRIRIESKEGEVVEVARDADNAWVLILPTEASADQGAVEAATSQITTIRVLDHIPDLKKDVVGLDDPEFTFTIQFTGEVERIIEVGVLTPTGSGYYASRDNGETLIVSNTVLDSLIGFLSDPPYLEADAPFPPTLEVDTAP
ncbi:MAG TPA: DUF4340 domain-containing protein [Anaerolineales bacterium]|nr:DUF4340 domain-containing protein [Anaerolineales bacterium]